MARRVTVEPVGEDEEIDFHPEGVALFTPNESCFGMSLSDIVEEVKPEITAYGEAVVMEPHDGCLSVAVEDDVNEQRLLYENSVWLVDCDCIVDSELFADFKHLIRTFPNPGNVVIWVDEDTHEISDVDRATLENFSTTPNVVYDKRGLIEKVTSYIEYSANPVNGDGSIADWRNEVHRMQKNLG